MRLSFVLLVVCAASVSAVDIGSRLRRRVSDEPKVLTVPAPMEKADVAAPVTAANDPRDPDFSPEKVLVPPPKVELAEAQTRAIEKQDAETPEHMKGYATAMKQEGNTIKVARVKKPDAVEVKDPVEVADPMEGEDSSFGASGGGVTKGFCADMLKKIEKKEAPYYLEGKFTGESRDVLVKQCSLQICGWAMEYHTKVSECAECPADCQQPMMFAKQLLAGDHFEKLLSSICKDQDGKKASATAAATADAVAAATAKVPAGPQPNDPRDPAFGSPLVAPTGGAESLNPGPIDNPKGGVDPDAPAANGGQKPRRKIVHGGVTKGFCTTMLKAIEAKEAPYYVEDKFTGETRDELIEQCSAQVCDWAVSYGKLTTECATCPKNCKQPMTEEAMKTFVNDVLGRLEQNKSTAVAA